MSFDYIDARNTAKELIEEFGQAGKVIKKGSTGGYDEHGNLKPDDPDAEVNGTITPLLRYNSNEIDGESIQDGDAYVFFHSDSDVDDWINYQVAVNGVTFRVVGMVTLDSVDDINVFRKLQLRR